MTQVVLKQKQIPLDFLQSSRDRVWGGNPTHLLMKDEQNFCLEKWSLETLVPLRGVRGKRRQEVEPLPFVLSGKSLGEGRESAGHHCSFAGGKERGTGTTSILRACLH